MQRFLPPSIRTRLLCKLRSPKIHFLILLPLFLFSFQFAQAQITVDFQVTDPACFGQPTGSITATATGGNAPYSYTWNTGAVGPVLSDITAGTYTVTVVDASNNSAIKNVIVTQPGLVSVTITAENCELPIVITATGDGGAPPYTYNWNTGQSGSTISVPGAGTYCVTMTDEDLCGAVECITVDFTPLDLDVTVNNITCPGNNDGQVTATPSGGNPPFTYLWNTGATTAAISGLAAGTYTVTVTDSEGCEATGSGTVIDPPQLIANATAQNPVCIGDNDGSATVVASGGTPPYTYLWSTGATTVSIAGLAPGGYAVTVTDVNGCFVVDNVVITPISNLNVSLQKNDESCPDLEDGAITAFPVGGVQPFTYLWSNGATTQSISGLAPGNYSVTVTDAQGCEDTESTIIMAAADLEISIIGSDVTVCDGTNGSATANVIDGEGPFTYLWSTTATTQTISGIPGGVYMVTVTDANGCTATEAVMINTPPDIIVTIVTSESTVCLGENTSTATAATSGGTPPFTYLWNTGETTQQITGLGAGTYTVTVTDAAQCEDEATVTIEAAPSLGVTISGDETVCDPEGEGFVSASPIGGTPPFIYNWSTGATTASIGNLPEGTYTVTVTDALGCTAIESVDIEIVDDFILDIIVTNPLCPGDENGSILAEGWGGTPPYIYQWSTGFTGGPLLENVGAGNYSVTVSDQNGCQLIENFVLVDPPAVVADISATQELCPGELTGMAMAMASGGTPPFTYLWNTGAMTQMITGLGAGTYTVTVTDSNGCEDEASVTIQASPELVVVISGDETICDPEGEGLATAMASGGTPPYNYLWSNGATTQAIANLPEGDYSVTVTDALGCTAVDQIDIDIVDDFILDIIVTNPLCPGDENGSILAEGWGGTPPYVYQWSTGFTGGPLLENVGAGNYSVTVSDQNGCQLIENFVLVDPPTLSASINATSEVCPGTINGTAMAVGSGGTPPYTYEWSTGDITQMIVNLGAGTYTVTITDSNECEAVASVEIEEFDGVTALITGTNIVCGSETDGVLTAMATSGTAPFTYLWSTGATSQTIINLGGGTYSVTVTDANGCEDDTSFTISISDDLAVNGTSKNLLCYEDGSGEATANPSGGTPPYAYQWNTGSMNQSVTGLAAGFYMVTVTDDNGCTAVQDFIVSQPPVIEIDGSAGDLVCPDETNGTAMVMASGGTAPYTYEWSTGATTQMISGIGAGTYTVTVTDVNDCEAVETVTVEEAPELNIEVDAPEVVCGAGNTGEASVQATGGLPPYTYEWSTGESDTQIENLPEGNYTITVTDANGCTQVQEIFIEVVEDFSITVVPRDVLCNGDNTGSILVTAEGGTEPYTYEWSTGDTLSELINLSAGEYSLTVTDANDCTLSETVTIGEPPLLELDLDITDVTCADAADGQLIISVSGGNDASYTVFVDGNEVTVDTLSGLSGPDTITVTVRDANFCETTETAIINEPDAIELTLDAQNNPCSGALLGAVMTNVDGGLMPYAFEWSNGATTPDLTGVASGTYTVTVTDIAGCTATAEATVLEPDPIDITLNKTDIFCDDDGTGAITAVVSGGTPAYTYEWSNGATTATIDGLQPGQYTVTVTDLNECTAMSSITIESFPSLSLTPIATSPNCFGESNGAAAVSVSGGTPPFTYLWNSGSTTPELINIPGGFYLVTVTDAAGCTGVASVGVVQPEELIASVSISMTEDVSCNGLSDGQASVDVIGGSMPYTYEWSDGQTTQTATNLAAGTYTVTVTDANGCEDILDVEINEPEAISLDINADIANTCEGSNDGAASVSAMGGTPPFFYEWSNGETTPSVSNLAAGTYTVTVTDIAECTAITSIDIGSFPNPSCSIDVIQEVTLVDNGELGATVSGGSAPYTYLWSNGETTPTISGLTAGDYSLTITDDNGCSTNCTITIEAFAGIGNYVWEDIDHDGVQDDNEPPFPDVEVKLKDADGNVLDTQTTDANGNYLFLGLIPGEYSVMFVVPDSFQFTQLNIGNDVFDSDADPAMDGMTINTTLVAGEIDTTWDAGIYLTPYDDIEDPCICLNNSTTDENGQFLEVLTIFSYPNETWTIVEQVGMYDINSPAPPAAPIPVAPNTVIPESATPGAYTFEFKLVDAEPYSIFTVTNGFDTLMIDNVCEYPNINLVELPPVELCVTDDVYTPEVNPNVPGVVNFFINGIPVNVIDPSVYAPGDYEFIVELIPTDPDECSTTIITEFTVLEDCLSKVGDFVWFDEDRDGIQDPNEDGVEGVMVILQDPTQVDPVNVDTTFTDANGNYCFFVDPGDYKITFMLPDGYVFSPQDVGPDDSIDSDADPDMNGMTEVFTVMENDTILTIDAGIDTKCDNIDDPGLIGPNQFLCGPGNDPDPIINIEFPTGGTGAIEYLWMQSTVPGPFNLQTWEIIPGATGDSYDPGPLSETTYFARCARRECCIVYLESNIVTIEVGNVAVADINGPDFICVGEPTTFFAGPTGANAQIEWTFSPGLTPQTATGPQVIVDASSHGSFTITLEVTENGCTSTDIETITATNSPIYCGSPMPLTAEVTNEIDGEVMVSWMTEEFIQGHTYTVEHSADGGTRFEAIATVDQPSAYLGVMNYYEQLHEEAKRGRNLYRLRIENPQGQIFYSEEAEAILYGDSEIALLYPNPTEEIATLELFETFGESVSVELLGVQGNVIQSVQLAPDAQQLELDVKQLPSGTYFIKLNYSKSGVKVLKLLKK